jgi:hypothetical protein
MQDRKIHSDRRGPTVTCGELFVPECRHFTSP